MTMHQELADTLIVAEEKETNMEEQIAEQLADALRQIEELKSANLEKQVAEQLADALRQIKELKSGSVKKNHVVGKADPNRRYTLLTTVLRGGMLIPHQQADIAKILVGSMTVGKEYTEQEVFDFLIDGCGEFVSLTKSVQDVTYLFKFYRGVKKAGKYLGFVARGFIRQRDV